MRATPWPLATPRQASPRLPRRVSLLTTSRGGRGASSCRRQSNRELRKDTFWGLRRRGKARCVIPRQAKLRLSVRRGGRQTALFREASGAECAFPSRRGAWEVWGNPPPGCGALWRMPQLGKCARATPRQAAGRVARGSANLGLEFGLTEKRTLRLRCYGKPQSATLRCDGDSLLDHCRHGQLLLPVGPERQWTPHKGEPRVVMVPRRHLANRSDALSTFDHLAEPRRAPSRTAAP